MRRQDMDIFEDLLDFNEKHRSFNKVYLENLRLKFDTIVERTVLSPLPQNNEYIICNRYKPLNLQKVTEKYFPNETVKYSKTGKYPYFVIKNSNRQSSKVYFYRVHHTEKISMNIEFGYDGYFAFYTCSISMGKDHEWLQSCFESFHTIIELWQTEVVAKFNESLGLNNE